MEVGGKSSIPRGGAGCLRAFPTKRVLDAQTPYLLNEIIIDGKVIPVHPSDAYRAGRINRVTLVNGSTHDEGRFFVALPELMTGKAMTDEDYPVGLERQYGRRSRRRCCANTARPLRQPERGLRRCQHRQHVRLHGLAVSRAMAGKIPVSYEV